MNFKMPQEFKTAYKRELEKYEESLLENDFQQAWHYLERAHIIGQYHPVSHTGIHFRMLLFGFKTGNAKEILGQSIRMSVGWIGSLLNRIPVGNTGSSSVPIFSPMPIPADLRLLLKDADMESRGLAGLK
ncbi:DUF3703 domain-containing protein [Leptospira sp. FAT2]|uniref:DUF3703 domain-containing protein n=1 Tax=Leptospira sanjuanensis TaxID=2879643 RepID=UPI001EE7D287|nr:DUF3703 domain-containing protein [Leptospira sanjuanensis]MCG6192347.1 DUF3703 domain-containing protein [Leptospira sanjuanensis]